ncbi:cation diffusion facilitator family transporter [Methanolobus halotolerans]|uniref:Cation transporter n=1 Tax=Methanolobus halotolerans TaxID=2052935 RepID=A0A4E0PYS2_9EURY|nr:cation diffusion facilitator family transporter [Methanolobus halotolerans]TGC10680.1 cation transporter [Methanolobus halotolerans]
MVKSVDVQRALKVAIFLTSIFFILEVIGGILSGSLALLGDAGHMLRDIFSLVVSLGAIKISRNLEPTITRTFGYHRVEIFAALINGFLLIGVSLWIIIEAYQRFLTPEPVESTIMLIVALVGLSVNVYVTLMLHGSHDLNVQSAFMHVLTDTLSSVAVIFASVWIYLTGQVIVDPILSVVIALFIMLTAVPIIRESLRILLEFVPKDLKLEDVISDIENTEGVEGVHHVHFWSLSSQVNALNAHIFTLEQDMAEVEKLKRTLKKKLAKYRVKHATLEFEFEECSVKDYTCHVGDLNQKR